MEGQGGAQTCWGGRNLNTLWVEVNLSAIAWNLRKVKGLLSEETGLMAVVKANGYGSGSIEPALTAIEAGASCLGVFRVEEGLELRRAGIVAPILVMKPLDPEEAEIVLDYDLIATLDSMERSSSLARVAERKGKEAHVHVKVDTGMGRFGVRPEESLPFLQSLKSLPFLRIEGIYTHLASAFYRDAQARHQLDLFQRVLDSIAQEGLLPPIRHAANSAAILAYPDSAMDMVRVGNLLFGICPFPRCFKACPLMEGGSCALRPTWEMKARIISIKKVRRGTKVGYGGRFVAKRDSLIATLPVGLADGFGLEVVEEGSKGILKAGVRTLGFFRPSVTFRGKRLGVAGRIGLQASAVDVTGFSEVKLGEEVLIEARRTAVGRHVPRIYLRG